MSGIRGYYQVRLQSEGEPHEANDYGSARSQKFRFRVATESLGIRNGDTVVDVGCGTGEYCSWLWNNGYEVLYKGVDDHPKMLQRARDRTGSQIEQRDVIQDGVPSGDWGVALGILGVIDGNEYQRWQAFDKLVRHLHNASALGFAFTVQSARSNWKKYQQVSELRWYADPSEVVRRLNDFIPHLSWQIRCDYHPFDLMVVCHKGPPFVASQCD